MQVGEVLNFNTYWNDPRFLRKRPNLNGSLKAIYGDNIYRREGKRWIQADSHHSDKYGRPDKANIARDTRVDRLLVATKFVYWGKAAPVIPKQFRPFKKTGEDICNKTQGHRVFGEGLAEAFAAWLEQQGTWGFQGDPLEFAKHERVTVSALHVASSTMRRTVRRSAR
jgi:hypothetical protein